MTTSSHSPEVITSLPDILGYDQDGNLITRESLKGRRVILYTYPKDNTSGCTAEACSLRDHYAELQSSGYDVIGVSKDSAASHQRFIGKHDLPFPLIADTETTLLKQMGAWGEKVACGRRTVGTLRTTFLIDEDGNITRTFLPKEIKTKIHAEQILAEIK
ncbi:MAG: peroxiredoxin [Prevotella sp.]